MAGSISVIIFILILVGIDYIVKYKKKSNINKEKDYISKLENTDEFISIINKYLPKEYSLSYSEIENIRIEKDILVNDCKKDYFREGREVKPEAIKSFDEYAMRTIYNYYDKELYNNFYELKKEGVIELVNSEKGVKVSKGIGDITYDENGKAHIKDKEFRTPYTENTYKLNDRGVVKFKIFLSSIIYFIDTFANKSIVDEYKENIDNREFTRTNMHYN
jgi:hypothetical protein